MQPPEKAILLRRLYGAALSLAVVLCFAEVISVPLLVTFDGYWYAKLAEILGTRRFEAEWDYLRTPVYPALLKLFFWLFGRQPLAVIGLQTALGFSGIALLAATLKRLGHPVAASVLFPLLAMFPTLVTYEHALLTEVGTFFFLALLVYVATAPTSRPGYHALVIAAVLATAYYHRASVLYISPAIALVYGATYWWRTRDKALERRARARLAISTVAVMAGPFVAAYPWQTDPRVYERAGHSVVLYGIVKQAVVPPEDPIWTSGRQRYVQAIAQSSPNGELPPSGIHDQLVYEPLDSLREYAPRAGSVLFRAVTAYPSRYLAGCLRTSLLFTELYADNSDTASFRAGVLSGGGSLIAPRPPGFPPLDIEMAQPPNHSFFVFILGRVAVFYDRMVLAGVLATLIFVVAGIWRRDAAILALGVIPVAFLLLNILLLSSQDRIAAPAYPLLVTNLIAAPAVLWNRRKRQTSAAAPADTAAAATARNTRGDRERGASNRLRTP